MSENNGAIETGFNGKILVVDLSNGSISVENVAENLYREYLGGYGLGARFLWDRVPAGIDPLAPENMLGLLPGLLTGTPLFGQRWQAVCKSPLTGGWGDANCGGDFGGVLKLAGWDGVLFFGKSENPTYLLVEGEKVELRDASDLWGTGAIESEVELKARHGKRASVANIGQAGETLSLISGICNDHGRLAARSGVGAVMGSKNLKAIVVRGKQKPSVANPDAFKILQKLGPKTMKPTGMDEFGKYGTPGVCSSWQLYDTNQLIETLNAVTGWDTDMQEILEVGERRVNMMRAFNAR